MDSHGKYDIKFGDLANGKFTVERAILATLQIDAQKEKANV
jgi:hypothetical protein